MAPFLLLIPVLDITGSTGSESGRVRGTRKIREIEIAKDDF